MYKATDKVWDWYIEQCDLQGTGKEAREVRRLIKERFSGKK